MASTIQIGHGSVYKDIDKIFTGAGGAWKEADSLFCGASEVWKEGWKLAVSRLFASYFSDFKSISVDNGLALYTVATRSDMFIVTPDGSYVYRYVSTDGTIKKLNPALGIVTSVASSSPSALAIAPNGNVIAAYGHSGGNMYDANLNLLGAFSTGFGSGHTKSIAIGLGSSSDRFAMCSTDTNYLGKITAWDYNRTKLWSQPGASHGYKAVPTSDGNFAFVDFANKKIYKWSGSTGAALSTINLTEMTSGGSYGFIVGDDALISYYDTGTRWLRVNMITGTRKYTADGTYGNAQRAWADKDNYVYLIWTSNDGETYEYRKYNDRSLIWSAPAGTYSVGDYPIVIGGNQIIP